MSEPLGWIDYQRFFDGSNRWLWQIRYRGRLWRAGLEHRLDDARRAARCSWNDLLATLAPEEADQLGRSEELERADWHRNAQEGPGGTPASF